MAEASRSGATSFKMQGDSWPSETISGTSLTAEYSHSTGFGRVRQIVGQLLLQRQVLENQSAMSARENDQ